MKSLNTFIAFLTIAVLFSCCKPIDLTADYKDITISYGILNPKDEIHYFKIYKGFITDENAYEAALDPDNIYYPVDSIEVRFEEYINGTLTRSAILDTTTQVEKEQGDFAGPKQILYYSDWKLNTDATYRLVIYRKATDDIVYAETMITGDFTIRRPMVNWNMNLDNKYKIQFYQSYNAALYDIYLTFYYIEVDNNTGNIEHKQLQRKLNSDYIRATNSTEINYNDFTPVSFFNNYIQAIPENPNVTRYIDAIDGQPYRCLRLTVWAADNNYLTYREVATPNSSIVQNRLEYTNFVSKDETAYGLLASRNYAHADLTFDNTMGHNEDTLVLSERTKRLNFDYYRNSPLFEPLR